MAKFVAKTVTLVVNGVDLSDHVREVTVSQERDQVEVTGFGATAKEYVAGLGDATIVADFIQDYAGGETDATLSALATSDTPFLVQTKPTNAAISSTNPEYQLTALLLNYQGLNASVGSASTTSVTFVNASQTGLTRDITP